MTTAGRTASAFAIASLLALALVAVGVVALKRVSSAKDRPAQDFSERLILIETIRSAFERKVATDRGYLLSGSQIFVARQGTTRGQFLSRLSDLKRRVASDRKGTHLVGEIDRLEDEHQRQVERLVAQRGVGAARGVGPDRDVMLLEFETKLLPLRDAVDDAIRTLAHHQRVLLEEARIDASRASSSATNLILLMGGLALAPVLALGVVLTRRQLRDDRLVRKLEESEERFRVFVGGVEDYALYMLDRDGRIEMWNYGAERMSGFRADEVLGKSHRMFYTQEDRDRGEPERHLREAEATGRYSGEGLRVCKGERTYWTLATKTALRNLDGSVRGYAVVLRDISERREHEAMHERLIAEAREAARAQEEFLSVASHDLKSPLFALSMQIERLTRVIERGGNGAPLTRIMEGLEKMRRQTARMTDLITYLLDLSKLSLGGRIHIELVEVDMAAVVREVVEAARQKIETSGSTVTVEARLPVVGLWDPLRLEQIVTNLLDNAIKYGEGKPVEVEVASESDEVARLVVRDHGIGIAADRVPHIFDRFVRATAKARASSFGLGLWIVRKVVTALGGTVGVQTEPGNGSTFTVELPRGGPSSRREFRVVSAAPPPT